MLAKRVEQVPTGAAWIFEPKWDGFRALVFRDGDEVFIQSRDSKPLLRYFPELSAPLLSALPQRCVLDGEIVIAGAHGLEFESLQLRLHPVASRIKTLSQQIPASIVFFDLLCDGDNDLRGTPFFERRAALVAMLGNAKPPIHVTPATNDHNVAVDWFKRFEGAGLDGVMAKASQGTYEPNKRTMLKVKHERDCDCVVAGFRWHKDGKDTHVGSLLLGLYDAQGELQHVGVCSSFTQAKRRELAQVLAPLRTASLASHPWKDWASADADAAGQRRPGAASRWSNGKDMSWEAIEPSLVAQVAYDHMQGARFRHIAHFRRWRPDKSATDCTFTQLEVVPPHELAKIFKQA